MLGVIGQLLPLAVAVALSSVPILAVLVILLGASRFAVPTLFVVGYVVGLLVMTTLFALGSRAIPAPTSAAAQPIIGTLEIVIGSALATYATILGIRHRRTPPRDQPPGWMLALGRLRPLPALGLGLALNVRPKSILLAVGAGLVIGSAKLTPSSYAIVLAVYIVIGASSVGGPACFAILRPTKAHRPLVSAERWLLRNRGTVATIVGIVVGIVIVGNGMTRF
jgi:hypothetical protein